MALFTPRGLKLRITKSYAFALMMRLFPQVQAFRILQLTEEIDNLPQLGGFLAGLIAFLLQPEPIAIGITAFATTAVLRIAHLRGLLFPPISWMISLSHPYSLVSGYGITTLAVLALGYFMSGWVGVCWYLGGLVASSVLFWFIELQVSRATHKKTGIVVTASERSFFHAYRLTAERNGKSTSLEVSDEELAPSHWMLCFLFLSKQWPEVVARFTD